MGRSIKIRGLAANVLVSCIDLYSTQVQKKKKLDPPPPTPTADEINLEHCHIYMLGLLFSEKFCSLTVSTS